MIRIIMDRSHLRRAVRTLEEAGIIVCRLPRHQRQGLMPRSEGLIDSIGLNKYFQIELKKEINDWIKLDAYCYWIEQIDLVIELHKKCHDWIQ